MKTFRTEAIARKARFDQGVLLVDSQHASSMESVPAQQYQRWYEQLRGEVSKVIVGQEEALQQVIVSILSRGHALAQGLPGLAKSLLVRSLADVVGLRFQRIQFTPDLMPADLTGTEAAPPDLESGGRGCQFASGPIFANFVLADDIEQAPPRTQAAVFAAMQERQISVNGRPHPLPDPFFVLATQHPLPDNDRKLRETQLDRFLLSIHIDYPSGAEEWEMARRATSPLQSGLAPQLSAEELGHFQDAVGRVAIGDRALGYAWTLVRATRPTAPEAPYFVDRWIVWGAGPRGLLALVICSKARALIHGRDYVTVEDIQALALPALRHRVVANPAAEANALTSDRLVRMIMESVPPEGEYPPPPGVAPSP